MMKVAIDILGFYGSNMIADKAGLKRVKPSVDDAVTYGVVDAMHVAAMLNAQKLGLPAMILALDPRVQKAIVTSLALIVKDYAMKKKLMVVSPILKALIGEFGNKILDKVVPAELQ